jgi:hypothetical protein
MQFNVQPAEEKPVVESPTVVATSAARPESVEAFTAAMTGGQTYDFAARAAGFTVLSFG